MKNDLFSNNYQSGLEDWLDKNQAMEYLTLIKLTDEPISINYLKKIIINTFEYIPYQNLTMLNRPYKVPSKEQIINDMLEGLGGLCTTLNPFLCALLHKLGFQVGLISASMKEPNCHMGIVVKLDNLNYWIDVGNGYPYLEPLLLKNAQKYKVLNFSYELLCIGDEWHVYQSILGTNQMNVDQYFKLNLMHYSSFESMRIQHHTNSSYGHFLKTIRINRWEKTKAYILRDNLVLDIPFSRAKVTQTQGKNWVKKNFFNNEILAELFDESWNKIYG